MLNSEEQVKDIDANGYETTIWRKTRTRNEALDLTCYNSALCDFYLEEYLAESWKAIMIADPTFSLYTFNERCEFFRAQRFTK
jgi:phage terminase large subunit GpA-like protein